jgi:hypothetical protein
MLLVLRRFRAICLTPPKAATDEERITLFKQGNTPNAIADAGHDDRKASQAKGHAIDGRVKSGSMSLHYMCPICAIPLVRVVEATVAAGVGLPRWQGDRKHLLERWMLPIPDPCSFRHRRRSSRAPVIAGVKVMPITGPIGTRALNEATDVRGLI